MSDWRGLIFKMEPSISEGFEKQSDDCRGKKSPSEKLHCGCQHPYSSGVQKKHNNTRENFTKSVFQSSFPLSPSLTHSEKHNHSHIYRTRGLPKTTGNPNKVQGQQSGLTELKPPTLAFITRNRISRGRQGHMGWGYIRWLCLSVWNWPQSSLQTLVLGLQSTPYIVTASQIQTSNPLIIVRTKCLLVFLND